MKHTRVTALGPLSVHSLSTPIFEGGHEEHAAKKFEIIKFRNFVAFVRFVV